MEALGYLAFSAAMYLTLRFFRIVFKEYIFNSELYQPADTAHSVPQDEERNDGFFEPVRERAC